MKQIVLNNKLEVLVDNDDFERLNFHRWGCISSKNYTYAARGMRTKGIYKKILMHRDIMNAPSDKMVDHINGNTLDNRKQNLRITTRALNLSNSKLRADSKCNYKGVHKRTSKKGLIRFSARIQINTKIRLFLGYFNTEIEAAEAYNNAAIKHFGEFAKLNEFKE